MVEVNFIGGLSTCSHGAGLNTQTLPDYVYEIEFVNALGELQRINRKDHPHLIGSAASHLGLMGITVSVTIILQKMRIINFRPQKARG
jgi:hypothetical protein